MNILFLALEGSESDNFFVFEYVPGLYDQLELVYGFRSLGDEVFVVTYKDWDGHGFKRMFNRSYITPVDIDKMDMIVMSMYPIDARRQPVIFNMLDSFSRTPAFIVNPPETIRYGCNKEFLFDLEKRGIPVIKTYRMDSQIGKLFSPNEKLIVKHKLGEDGTEVYIVRTLSELKQITDGDENNYLIQNYRTEFDQGEYSLVFLKKSYQYCWYRTKGEKSFLNNICGGGRAGVFTPTKKEIDFGISIIEAYESMGCPVYFCRIDFIRTTKGPLLNEIEVTNPGLLSHLDTRTPFFGLRFAQYIHDLKNAQ
jgi:glutathione synthase/RimK-type ligase-like ATP-grasp enzyme